MASICGKRGTTVAFDNEETGDNHIVSGINLSGACSPSCSLPHME